MFTRVSYAGLSLNDNANFHLTGVPGLSNPRIRRESYDMPQSDFGVFVEARYGERAFSLQGVLTASTNTELTDLRDQFSAAFSIFGGEQELKFEYIDRPSRSIFAVPDGEVRFDPSPDEPFAVQFSVPMVASFPFLQASSLTTLTIYMSAEGGASIPASVPMSLSMGSGGSVFAINDGTAPAILSARFYGAADNPALRNLTTGKDITLATDLASAEWIDVDFKLGQLRDNSDRNRYDVFRGEFFKLGVNATELRLVADTFNAETRVDVTFASTFLSI